jgi:hypothetical protein
MAPSSRALLEREFPELALLVAERYEIEAQIGAVDLYRLRAAARPAPPAGS